MSEDITRGQLVAAYRLEGLQDGSWRVLATGSTIGYAKLDRIPAGTPLRRVRLVIEKSVEPPAPVSLQLFEQA